MEHFSKRVPCGMFKGSVRATKGDAAPNSQQCTANQKRPLSMILSTELTCRMFMSRS